MQFPNTDHTSRVVPALGHSSEYNDFRSPVKPPLFLHNHVEARFFFYFQICTFLYNRNVYCEFWVRSFCLGYDRSNDPFWTPLFDLRLAAHPIIPNRSGLFGLVVEIFAFGTVASSVHLATCWWLRHRFGIPPFEWNWSDLRQTSSDRKFELGAEKWESENEERVLFCPWGEEICTRSDKEKWMWNICFYQPTKGLWCVCGGCFSVLFLHGIRRRNAFEEVSSWNRKSTSYVTWKLVLRDSSSTKNKFKICTFGQKVNHKNFNWIIEGYFLRWIPTSMGSFSLSLTLLAVRISTAIIHDNVK